MLFLFFCFFFFVYTVSGVLFFYSFFFESFLFDFSIFKMGGLDLGFSFVFDYLSSGFFCCVSFISGIVFLYSVFYMGGTANLRRFVWLVFFFVLSMFVLVFSGNFIMTMVGWDGLGLVSFCLVIFYGNSSSLESGLITVFSNRVGDVFFLVSFLFFFLGGSFGWDVHTFNFPFISLIFIFLGAITKSAQVPFSAWLPAAMAAPTPVSSLVHSSTLVTAGVYVLIRFNYMFYVSSLNFLKLFFLFTMLLAGVGAVLESDFKKIVAMSTLSQLGMMLFVLSIGAWLLAYLHMIIHAFFKSMLFLSTGSLMGQMSGTQDSRFYGGFYLNYFSFLYFVVSCFCLMGFPFFLGFYSKDFIMAGCSFFSGQLYYCVFLGGCVCTVAYSVRLVLSSYLSVYKFITFYHTSEHFVFFWSVFSLFLKCWLVGGLMYWFFLFNSSFFFSFFDLLTGIFVMASGAFLYYIIYFFYYVFLSVSTILFLRWKSGGGSSFLFSWLGYSNKELTWMEYFGGLGVYSSLTNTSSVSRMFTSMGLGMLILASFVSWFHFF